MWKNYLKAAKLEADLMQVNSITHLAWVPNMKQKKKGAITDATLKGHFLIKLIQNDKTLRQ